MATASAHNTSFANIDDDAQPHYRSREHWLDAHHTVEQMWEFTRQRQSHKRHRNGHAVMTVATPLGALALPLLTEAPDIAVKFGHVSNPASYVFAVTLAGLFAWRTQANQRQIKSLDSEITVESMLYRFRHNDRISSTAVAKDISAVKRYPILNATARIVGNGFDRLFGTPVRSSYPVASDSYHP